MTQLTWRTDGTGVRAFRNPVLPGCWVAVHASSNGRPSRAVADVDRVQPAGWDLAAWHPS